jgi:transposase
MNRTAWLQDRRMQKFRDVLSRWERQELSALEAGEILGVSERQFRRYRRRYEEDGVAGRVDRRLGKESARRVPVDRIAWMLGQYRTHHIGWNVKHFHEHIREQHGFRWGYTWTKTQLHTAKLVERAARRGAHRRKRPRKPCEGMMLHQDGSRFAWPGGFPQLDLIVSELAPIVHQLALWRDRFTPPPGEESDVLARHPGPCRLCCAELETLERAFAWIRRLASKSAAAS